MTSGSSVAPRRVGDYDIFISHCGADCKRDFAVLLKEDLERVGVRCFFDEHSLEVGDQAAEKMLEAMEEATYGVVILSPGFFDKEWCMKELETFVRRGRMVPIFYGSFEDVQAAKQTAIKGGVWTTFKQFVRTQGEYCKAAKANTERTGVRLAEEGWWSSCIRRVRDEVLRLLGKEKGGLRISEDELLVGQREHLMQLKGVLGVVQQGAPAPSGASVAATSREVGIVGVKGMGGVGKTTLAKKLYDEPDVREWFADGICWLEVGPNPTRHTICQLQSQVIEAIFGLAVNVGNPTVGRALIRKKLQGKRVLICLDDVWEHASIATDVLTINDLGAGSRILKTSRVREAIGGWIHDLDSLGQGPAWELFCWHAFGGEQPQEDLTNRAKKAALRCGGLPLALRVLGRQVAEANNKNKCLQTFLDFPQVNDAMIDCRSIIRTSLENLPREPHGLREVFVLVAGVWPRTSEFMDRGRAVENLGAAVYGRKPKGTRCTLAHNALDKLSSLSLIGLKEDGVGEDFSVQLTVHDLIVDVAEIILAEEAGVFYRQPVGGRKRKQLPHNSRDLMHLFINEGPISIQGLRATCSLILGPGAELLARGIEDGEHSECRLLVVEGGQTSGLQTMTNLQCLRLLHCAVDKLPMGIKLLEDLCILDLRCCRALTSLPEGIGALTGLTTLDLSECRALTGLPEGIGALTGLTTLGLMGCQALTGLPEGIGRLTGLTTLNLGGCKALTGLPEGIGALTGLTALDLSGCYALTGLPEGIGALTGLTTLNMRWCTALTGLPEGIGRLTGLTTLDLSECHELTGLPEGISALTGLTTLDLRWCEALTGLPEGIGRLTGLTTLTLGGCKALTGLLEGIGALTGLTALDLSGCYALTSLPQGIGALSGLTTLDLEGCGGLPHLPEGIRALARLTTENRDYLRVATDNESE